MVKSHVLLFKKTSMKDITNVFKKRLLNNEIQYGVWNGIPHTIVGEILAGSGFDWILIDGEHATFDLQSTLTQMQAIGQFDVPVIVRVPVGDQILIKQMMDIGVQTLLVPNVETAEQARQCVSYMRYAPEGVRGVGTALARAAQWNRVNDYFKNANDEMCLVVQVETVKGVKNLDEILKVENVDAVFIGPADLAASMGYLGEPGRQEVVDLVNECLEKIEKSDKKAGILTTSDDLIQKYISKGTTMVGIGLDTLLLAKSAQNLAQKYKNELKNITSNTKY